MILGRLKIDQESFGFVMILSIRITVSFSYRLRFMKSWLESHLNGSVYGSSQFEP